MNLQIDMEHLKKIFLDYKKLVNLNISLHDKEYNSVITTPGGNHNFCQQIREDKAVKKRCHECDIRAFKHVEKTKELYVYKCHMGFYEAVAPIMDNDMIIGFIMVGQILDEQAIEHQWLRVRALCLEYELDESLYEQMFLESNQMSYEKVEASANIMHACATYLCYKNIMKMERSDLFSQIDRYVTQNLQEVINQEVLCKQFHVSRSTLYNTITANMSMPLTGFVQKKRMVRMSDLLLETDLRIKDISDAVGISDYNYSSRLFKREYGLSPRAYRQKYKDTNN